MLRTRLGIVDNLPGEYLLDALFAIGPSRWTGEIEGPITWEAIAAYKYATDRMTEPWECEAVMAMSRAYFHAKVRGKEVHAIQPVYAVEDQE